jgi:hypothetical protein
MASAFDRLRMDISTQGLVMPRPHSALLYGSLVDDRTNVRQRSSPSRAPARAST